MSARQEVARELEVYPLECGEVRMEEKKVWKWLGQHLSSGGLGDSVAETVRAREAKVKSSEG